MDRKMLSDRDTAFFGAVILIETVTYTTSFLISGLAKKDIFNCLEGKETAFLRVIPGCLPRVPILLLATKDRGCARCGT